MRSTMQRTEHRCFYVDVAELDVCDAAAVRQYVHQHEIEVIVNCAAYTNVDRAEDDEATAYAVNCTAVDNMAQAMKECDGWLLHVSTDYVFGGIQNCLPCTEQTPAAPLGAYGRTKWAGEEVLRKSGCRYLIVRTAWLYSEYGTNFAKTMLRLFSERTEVKVVFDQVGTPTYAGDLASALTRMVEAIGEGNVACGTYHYSNEGVCSWYDFAVAIARESNAGTCRVLPCHSNEFPSKVHRPAYSVLDKTAVKSAFDLEIPHWEASVQRCITNLLTRQGK